MSDFFIKRKLKKEFLKEHKAYIPNYSPKGQRLDWRIWVYWDGEFDTMTGKPINGEYRVAIEQKAPRFSCDNTVYEYDIKNKKMKPNYMAKWGY